MSKSDEKNNSGIDESPGEKSLWVVVAETTNRTEADFAINGLKSYDIPAVLDATPGVFGSAGLPMQSIYKAKTETFKIMVPAEFEEEASDLVNMFLSDSGADEDKDDYNEEDGDDEEDDKY